MKKLESAPVLRKRSHQTNGVYNMVPREKQEESARKLRDTYAIVPDVPFFKREFGYYCLERWEEQGMPQNVPFSQLFDYDPPGNHALGQLGWCEAAFEPKFEEKILEDRGKHEVIQDFAGRKVLCFTGRRSGFMPEYLSHPVKDMKTWDKEVKWRLDPGSHERYCGLASRMEKAKEAAAQGLVITQNVIGGFMYLRSLIGPADLLYKFYDIPDLIHDCMETWLKLTDTVISRHQEHVTIDELFLAEDICYNHGPLISPDMIREFLFPYYQQLIANIRTRQIDKTRYLHIQVDTDGFAVPVISLYQEIGLNIMSPFEVASGCDVVEIGRQFPNLVLTGGIDKRVLARSKKEINRELERIFPVMRRRGGYIPTCDHGVPEEVSYANYLYYRKRCVELGG